MKFKIKKGRHLCNEGEVYETTIIEKKLNGYKVLNPDNDITFITFDDIEILEISNKEKEIPISL